MKKITVEIDYILNGKRIGYVLEKHLGLSSTLIKRLKRIENAIMLNEKQVTLVDTVNTGDVLAVTIHDRESKNIIPSDIPLDILYEDEDIIIINKPRCMPTHPSRRHTTNTLANAVVHHLNCIGAAFHAITRLDKDTSGVVLVAKNTHAAKLLTDDISSGRIHKEYVAVVNGVPNPKTGTISASIKRAEPSEVRRCVCDDGKEAITNYAVEMVKDGLSMVKLFPVTGRTHQLRVHMNHIGTPIYGDALYSEIQEDGKTRLHCRRITFFHPMSRKKVSFEAPIPEDMIKLM